MTDGQTADQTADQIADQINATYNVLSAQYRTAIDAEDAAWAACGRVGLFDHAGRTAAEDAAERATGIRREISRQLDAELARLNARTAEIARRVTGRG